MKSGSRRPKPAMVISVIALIVALTGTAYAALGKNTVGSRQLKSKAVTGAKFANDSVTTAKVSRRTVGGENIDLSRLGTVPSAGSAVHAANATTLDGHPVSCPAGTKLVRGLCFDTTPNGPVLGVKAAADGCAAKGGYLPTVEQLESVRSVIDLGDGNGTHAQFTDSYYYDLRTNEKNEPPGPKLFQETTVISSNGPKPIGGSENIPPVVNENPNHEIVAEYEYICSYPLIREIP